MGSDVVKEIPSMRAAAAARVAWPHRATSLAGVNHRRSKWLQGAFNLRTVYKLPAAKLEEERLR